MRSPLGFGRGSSSHKNDKIEKSTECFKIYGKSHYAEKNVKWPFMLAKRFVPAKKIKRGTSVEKTSEEKLHRAENR